MREHATKIIHVTNIFNMFPIFVYSWLFAASVHFGAFTVDHMGRNQAAAEATAQHCCYQPSFSMLMICMSTMYNWDKSTHSLKKHTDKNQLRQQCPTGNLSGFLKTLKHSPLILRFMVHLCYILIVIWLIE